ncbi:hypothetical protein SCALM49S_02259 [Streptomyces californicus]
MLQVTDNGRRRSVVGRGWRPHRTGGATGRRGRGPGGRLPDRRPDDDYGRAALAGLTRTHRPAGCPAEAYNVHPVPLTTLTLEALKEFGLPRKEAERSKNMFALGLLS